QRPGKTTDLKRPTKQADRVQRLLLAILQKGIDLRQALLLRVAQMGEEHRIFITKATLDGDGRDVVGMLIKVRPGKGNIGSAEFRSGGGDEPVGFGEDGAPARLGNGEPPSL